MKLKFQNNYYVFEEFQTKASELKVKVPKKIDIYGKILIN